MRRGKTVLRKKPNIKISAHIVRKLQFRKKSSKKGDYGHLLIVSGFGLYHGALLYALRAASRIVDIIYVYTSKDNQKIVRKLKSKSAEFVVVKDLNEAINRVDCILIGPGLGRTKKAYSLVGKVLRSGKKAVLDADALSLMDSRLRKLLNNKHIVTPHQREFARAFGMSATKENILQAGKKFGCTIVLKGKVDLVYSPGHGLSENHTGNEGMTKGGTGDVLAGLIAALFVGNEAYLSAAAGVYLNGLAGDRLYKKVGEFYNAEDLVEELPKVMFNLTS